MNMASHLEELAAKISAEVAKFSKTIEASDTPKLKPENATIGGIGSSVHSKAELDPSLLATKYEIASAAQTLLRLVQGPIDHIVTLSYGSVDTANLAVIVRFQIPQNVPFGASISLDHLATITGLDEDILARTVRYAITNGLFDEPTPGRIVHTAATAALAKNKGLHDMAVFNTGFSTRIIDRLADALITHQNKSDSSMTTAFNICHPGYADLFDYMGKNAEDSQAYFKFLDGRSQLPRYSAENIVNAWNWASIDRNTVIDIGGSSGYTSIELAKAFPQLRLVVQDMNTVGLEKGQEIVSKEPGLRSRIMFVEHDFFQTQPLTAEVYLFRQILHDWSDTDCVRILKALLPALKTGARILISECVMPEPPAKQGALLENKEARIVDQVMLAAHGGRERSVAEYSALFEQASKGFKYVGVSENITSGYYSLIEYRFTELSPATKNVSKVSIRAVKCCSCLF